MEAPTACSLRRPLSRQRRVGAEQASLTRMMAVAVKAARLLSPPPPRMLFRTPVRRNLHAKSAPRPKWHPVSPFSTRSDVAGTRENEASRAFEKADHFSSHMDVQAFTTRGPRRI